MRNLLNLPSNTLNKVDLRVLSQFLSPAYISSIFVQEDNLNKIKLKKFLQKKQISFTQQQTLGNILDQCYNLLLSNYQNEYTYKNELVKALITDKFKLTETIVLNEFKVGKSIVDTVLLNGKDKAFEIKTELDNADRLLNQLLDYKKAFRHVYLVTHINQLKKYSALLTEDIGVIAFNDQMQLDVISEAKDNTHNLCIETMMRCLRKSEYLNIVSNFFGSIPQVNDIDLFKTCLSWVKQLCPIDFQSEFILTLKNRRLIDIDLFESTDVPASLVYTYHSLNLSQNQYISLIRCLKNQIN